MHDLARAFPDLPLFAAWPGLAASPREQERRRQPRTSLQEVAAGLFLQVEGEHESLGSGIWCFVFGVWCFDVSCFVFRLVDAGLGGLS